MGQLNLGRLNSIADRLDVDATSYTTLIETGTCTAETTINVAPYFSDVRTIEISPNYFQQAKINIANSGYTHIKQYLGDSIDVLPKLLESIDAPAVFWLDGHWMGGGPDSQGKKDCPLLEECKSIDNIYKPDEAILLIDDHRLFGTYKKEDWNDVTEDNILACFENFEVTTHYVIGEYPDDIWVLNIKRNN